MEMFINIHTAYLETCTFIIGTELFIKFNEEYFNGTPKSEGSFTRKTEAQSNTHLYKNTHILLFH